MVLTSTQFTDDFGNVLTDLGESVTTARLTATLTLNSQGEWVPTTTAWKTVSATDAVIRAPYVGRFGRETSAQLTVGGRVFSVARIAHFPLSADVRAFDRVTDAAGGKWFVGKVDPYKGRKVAIMTDSPLRGPV